jgi:chromatin structure-remodeling complex subunit RSC1/2
MTMLMPAYAKGRVLFFTAPPLNVAQPINKAGRALGHSARYLAAKARKDSMRAAKRKAEEADAPEREEAAKKAMVDEDEKLKQAVSQLGIKALKALEDQLAAATKMELEGIFNGQTRDGLARVLGELTEAQRLAMTRRIECELHVKEREAAKKTSITGMTASLEERI